MYKYIYIYIVDICTSLRWVTCCGNALTVDKVALSKPRAVSDKGYRLWLAASGKRQAAAEEFPYGKW